MEIFKFNGVCNFLDIDSITLRSENIGAIFSDTDGRFNTTYISLFADSSKLISSLLHKFEDGWFIPSQNEIMELNLVDLVWSSTLIDIDGKILFCSTYIKNKKMLHPIYYPYKAELVLIRN